MKSIGLINIIPKFLTILKITLIKMRWQILERLVQLFKILFHSFSVKILIFRSLA